MNTTGLSTNNHVQPEGRKIIAHGARRGNEPCAKEPPEGAEDGGAAIFRPVPGLRELRSFHTAYAVGYFLPLLRALIRSISRSPLSCRVTISAGWYGYFVASPNWSYA